MEGLILQKLQQFLKSVLSAAHWTLQKNLYPKQSSPVMARD